MKRAGFTMIELIFVIVILGILAAVAIPKLAATRTDASISKAASDMSTLVSEMGSYWTANGSWATGGWTDMTNVTLTTAAGGTGSAAAVVSTTIAYYNDGGILAVVDAKKGCFSVITTSDGNFTITSLTGGTSSVCSGAQSVAENNGVVTTHSFGGTGVTY